MNEKEFAVINEIARTSSPNQRAIVQKTGVSLGMVNLIIKRFVQKGYIKIKEIPPRRVCYMLTPKGMAEKARKSYDFTLRTVDLLRAVAAGVGEILLKEYQGGMRKLVIVGNGELSALAEMSLRNLNLEGLSFSRAEEHSGKNKVLCELLVFKNGTSKKVDVIAELSKRGIEY